MMKGLKVKGQVLILPSKKEGHIRRGGVIRKGNSIEDLHFLRQ